MSKMLIPFLTTAFASHVAAAAPSREAPAMTPETQFLKLPEGRIAYEDTGGDGPLVLAIPGLGDLRSEYRYLAPALRSAGYRVVTLDLRGHGDSDTGFADYSATAVGRDALALVRHLDAGPAVLVGTSLGAGAAAFAAALDPERVRGLVLVGPFVRDVPPGLIMSAAMRVLFSGPWKVSAWLWYFDSLFPTRKPPDHAAHKAHLEANLREPGRFDAALAMMHASKRDVEARLHEVRAPTLVVMGDKDPDFKVPKAEADLVAERVRGRTVMIEGAGHYPHAEQPEVTARAILAFLETLPAR